MQIRLYTFFTALLLLSCGSHKNLPIKSDETGLPMLQNDSVALFNRYESEMISQIQRTSNYNNPLTLHFKKYISNSFLKSIHLKKSLKSVYIEFTLDQYRRIQNFATNAPYEKLDEKLKKAFKKLNVSDLGITDFNPKNKYTLIVIQNTNQTPVVRCNQKAISLTPPIYTKCSEIADYLTLNKCSYIYLTDFLYNHVDLSYVNSIDIDNNHEIVPKFIVGKQGNVIAAKVESQNKELLESFYRAIKSIPKASIPAKLNGHDFFYGYHFPTSIKNIIRNNEEFKKFHALKKHQVFDIEVLMKEFILLQHKKKLQDEEQKYKESF